MLSSLNNYEIKSPKNLVLIFKKPKDICKISLNRNGKKIIKEIKLKEYPDKILKPNG